MRTLLSGGAGVGRLWRSASCIVGKAASGFHLLRVEAYSQTKTVPGGESIDSNFLIGRRLWAFKYYPNGHDTSTNSDYISLYLQLHNHRNDMQAEYKLGILDQVGNVAYGLPAKTGVFKSHGTQLCGHEHFIRREDLERREDLIKDDCVVFRCDVGGFTDLKTSCIALEDSDDDDYPDGDEYGLKPGSIVERYRRPQRRCPDDMEFVQWCLAQKHVG